MQIKKHINNYKLSIVLKNEISLKTVKTNGWPWADIFIPLVLLSLWHIHHTYSRDTLLLTSIIWIKDIYIENQITTAIMLYCNICLRRTFSLINKSATSEFETMIFSQVVIIGNSAESKTTSYCCHMTTKKSFKINKNKYYS